MIRFAAIALVGVLSAVGAARAVASFERAPASAPIAAQATLSDTSRTAGTAAQVVKGPDGHYWAEANVDGRAVKFLVDTGATAVALTTDDARRLGLKPETLSYTYDVATADGRARAAAVTLKSVSIAGARVNDVDALVIERGLHTSLLGMSYLGRLQAFEATQTALILRP